jgi:murein DD-endopeptidase MepM/ murein hydrolase activator NlpD
MTRGSQETGHGALAPDARPALLNPATPSRRSRIFRAAALAAATGLFAAAAAVGMVQQPDRSDLPPPRMIEKVMSLSPDEFKVSDGSSAPYISETRIRRGDTLAAVLQRLHLDSDALQVFLTHDPGARSIYKLYPGRSVQAATDGDGNLVWLRYVHTPGNDSDGQVVTRFLQVEPKGDSYTAQEMTEDTDRQVRVAMGTIESSLFAATDAAGIPDSVTLQMADILSSKIDFLRSLRQGDQFRVVYETRSHDGRYAGAGRVLALEFENQGKLYTAVWFSRDGDNSGAYYDFDGTSLRGAFLRTALKFSRISSTFGMRMHPIHKTWTGHKGVDYAAPTGTPIHSTSDGVVEFVGVQNGYGNVVIIKHDNKYSTLYGHQSRIAPGIRKGAHVTQGEVIGYVGMTGWATGPHLHYEFRINGTPVDPLSVDLPVAQKLDGKDAVAFAKESATYKQQLNMLAQFQQSMPAATLASAAPN